MASRTPSLLHEKFAPGNGALVSCLHDSMCRKDSWELQLTVPAHSALRAHTSRICPRSLLTQFFPEIKAFFAQDLYSLDFWFAGQAKRDHSVCDSRSDYNNSSTSIWSIKKCNTGKFCFFLSQTVWNWFIMMSFHDIQFYLYFSHWL